MTATSQQARGSFEVSVQPQSPELGEGLNRMRLEKQLRGDLEATGLGEMLTAGDHTRGAAGYVALERVTGTLHGRRGSFALQHWGTMSQAGLSLQVAVVPGSGTGELQGIEGTFTIQVSGGQHSYQLDYTLPAAL
jgi:hypothetical protein